MILALRIISSTVSANGGYMEIKDLLPIGSVVLLDGGQKKLNIIGVKQTDLETGAEYDYLGVTYPEGFINAESMFFFNHDSIAEICFKGMDDDERADFIEQLDEFYKGL